MGLGLHGGGLAVAKWLLQAGAQVTVTDQKTNRQLAPTVKDLKNFAEKIKVASNLKFVLGDHRLKDFQTADLLIKNPGVPRDSQWLKIAQQSGILIHNEASLFFLFCQTPIIAVTGSKGKSTTTDLIGRIFQAAYPKTLVAGNIRTTPMFAIIDQVSRPGQVPWVILELSSWQLELLPVVKKAPHTAVITNIYPEHLNTYRSLADYARAKYLISKYQTRQDNLVLNYDDARLRKLARTCTAQVTWFGLQRGGRPKAYLADNQLIWQKNQPERIIGVPDLKLPGQHNLANVLAAVAVAKLHNLSSRQIASVLRQYPGLPDRLELVKEMSGRHFYNDTTATAPIAVKAALASFSRPLVLIAGGTDKNLPVTEMAKAISVQVKFLVLLPGSGTAKLKTALLAEKFTNYLEVKSLPTAVRTAFRHSNPGDVILLSPGFASFGLFKHEFDRGQQFVQAVNSLRL